MIPAIRRFAVSILVTASLGFAAPSYAVTIAYVATDLPDAVVGEDLWQYSYGVSGSFVPFGGFNILFSPLLYSNLENPPAAVNPDWSILTVEPDPLLPVDGLYTATANNSNPSLADPFTVTFVWLGGPRRTPGSQPFEVFPPDFLPLLETGITQVPGEQQVPLPGTLALFTAGLLGLGVRRALSAGQRG